MEFQFSHSNTCTSVLSPLRFIRKICITNRGSSKSQFTESPSFNLPNHKLQNHQITNRTSSKIEFRITEFQFTKSKSVTKSLVRV